MLPGRPRLEEHTEPKIPRLEARRMAKWPVSPAGYPASTGDSERQRQPGTEPLRERASTTVTVARLTKAPKQPFGTDAQRLQLRRRTPHGLERSPSVHCFIGYSQYASPNGTTGEPLVSARSPTQTQHVWRVDRLDHGSLLLPIGLDTSSIQLSISLLKAPMAHP